MVEMSHQAQLQTQNPRFYPVNNMYLAAITDTINVRRYLWSTWACVDSLVPQC